jgi:hypothetical protein
MSAATSHLTQGVMSGCTCGGQVRPDSATGERSDLAMEPNELIPGKRYALTVRHYDIDPAIEVRGTVLGFDVISRRGLDPGQPFIPGWESQTVVVFEFEKGEAELIDLRWIEKIEPLS